MDYYSPTVELTGGGTSSTANLIIGNVSKTLSLSNHNHDSVYVNLNNGTAPYTNQLNQYSTLIYGHNHLQYYNISGNEGNVANKIQNPTDDWYHHITMNHANGSGYYVDVAYCFHSNLVSYRRIVGGVANGWYTFYHSGYNNIGSGATNYAAGNHLHDGRYVYWRERTNWNDSTVIKNVIGQLCWKNYGNNHTIFDASNGTTPSGTTCDKTNPGVNWSSSYPTLMGWNGSTTYGVRVDSCRLADNLVYFTTTGSNNAVNCNNTTSNAIVYYNSNGPSGMSTSDGALFVQAYNSNWVAQIAIDYRNGDIATRGKNNGTWQSWYKVWTTRLFDPNSKANTSGTYNGLNVGYATNANTASVANKLAITGYGSSGLTFYQTADSFDGNSGWAHYLICNHGDGSSYYHYTLALPFWSAPKYRRQTGSTTAVTSWYTLWSDENFNPSTKLDVSTFNSSIGDISSLLDKINGTVI